jgi:death-on-curing protein
MPLLESAIGRQHVGFGAFRKYPTPVSNAATLAFGICNDHPFHNGNKRTALVAMLAHLDANKLTLANTRQEDLFNMVIALADNRMAELNSKKVRPRLVISRSPADVEVSALASWLEPRLQAVKRGERQITYRELRGILKRFGIELHDPRGNMIDVYRTTTRKKGLVNRRSIVESQRIGRIGYHSEGEQVSMKTIKDVRRIAALREEDGCDSEAFYAQGAVFDVFINRYRVILRRLAHR